MTYNNVSAVHELLSLAKEIAQAEGLDERAALKRALAELPRLTNDARQNVCYRPGGTRKAPRVSLGRVRYRPTGRSVK